MVSIYLRYPSFETMVPLVPSTSVNSCSPSGGVVGLGGACGLFTAEEVGISFSPVLTQEGGER
jgi:hypothetical protein